MKSMIVVLLTVLASVSVFAEDVKKETMPAVQSTLLVAEAKPAVPSVYLS